ncbi:hypothetical protein AYI69_g8002 [Smittium culicis]|uniref:MULE transposase domain-containing protein n=1 Tax=Smittium culicis TaxID=133412 RepID=A0A1R1XMY5_9FUNG|nr:hypothetical protein AYI69_g8002 [Smittium culicis]
MMVVILDSLGQVFIISQAIVSEENIDNWTWFLENLKKGDFLGKTKVIVSDRGKGLLSSIHCKPKGPDMVDWVNNTNPRLWARWYTKYPIFGSITSTAVEVIFSALKNLRSLPPIDILVKIENYTLHKRNEGLTKAYAFFGGDFLLPNVIRLID